MCICLCAGVLAGRRVYRMYTSWLNTVQSMVGAFTVGSSHAEPTHFAFRVIFDPVPDPPNTPKYPEIGPLQGSGIRIHGPSLSPKMGPHFGV